MGITKEVWIKRKEMYGDSGCKNPKEWSKNLSKALKGKSKPWFLGKKLSDSHKKKIGEALKEWYTKNKNTEKNEIRIQNISNALKGKNFHGSGQFQKGQISGENHPRWNGGVWKKGYTHEFNNELRNEIRKRDNYTCQECFLIEKELGQKLDVHHIDFNKKNNNLNNLICLCRKCHSGFHANFDLNRKIDKSVLIQYYNNKLIERRLIKT